MSSPNKPPFDKGTHGPPLTPVPTGNGEQFMEGDDIPESGPATVTKEKLGDYLSNITSVNHYNLKPGSTPAVSHHNPEGSPPVNDSYQAGGSPNNTGANATFVDEAIAGGSVKESDYTLIGVSDYKGSSSTGEINPFIKNNEGVIYNKGVGTERGKGHTLLSNVPGHGVVFSAPGDNTKAADAGPHEIQQATAKILQNNRFHPHKGSPYVNDGKFSVHPDGAMGSLQKKMGRYDPNADQILVNYLQQVGRDIMIAGTGHAAGDQLAALYPSTHVQMGLPYLSLSVDDLKPSSFTPYKKVSGGYLLPNSGGSKIGSAVRNELSSGDTYGHLNSYFEKFTGTLPLGMITTAIVGAGIIAVQALAMSLLFLLASLLPASSPRKRNPYDPRTLPKGKRQLTPDVGGVNIIRQFFLDAFGIPVLEGADTQRGGASAVGYYMKALFYGMGTLFGLSDWDGMNWFDIPTALMSSNGQAGYAANIFRVCNRDLEKLVNIGKELTDKNNSTVNKIGAAIALLTQFSQVKSIKFINLCAKIGDIMIVGDTYTFSPLNNDADRYTENPLTRQFKSRVGYDKAGDKTTYSLTSVLRASALPSMYLIPDSFQMAAEQYGITPSYPEHAYTTTNLAPRFSRENVQYIEDQLDSEYVPFYFQDLRTNEIVAFHAFLEDISDDYSPEWNSVGGFGRMDPVQIFSKTSRSVSISFIVAATSKDDFDQMWFQLNKLTTLIYPQWSPGTAVKDPAEGKGHIMPFSQVPAASPLIRLRVGDLIRSNYSKFNLARIFGINNPDEEGSAFNVTSTPATMSEAFANDADEAFTGVTLDPPKVRIYNSPPNDARSTGLPDDAIGRIRLAKKYAKVDMSGMNLLREDQHVKITGVESGGIPILAPGPPENIVYKAEILSGAYEGDEVFLSPQEVRPDRRWLDFILNGAPEPDLESPPPESEVASFFSTKDNAIVRSFESTAGRGLACAVTSFSYDYGDSTWATHVLGGRAPKTVKVSMSFAVIHDLPPGLDSDGFNRAPIYPVGDIVHGMVGNDMHDVNVLDPKSTVGTVFSEYGAKDKQTDEEPTKD
jgi:hypothetical protein